MRSPAWNPQYHQIVLATDPIAYWLQDEKRGNVSYDWVRRRQGSDQDGAYTGATLGQPGIGDGRTSPFFDGANDFNNIFTPAFQGRFNGSEGSVQAMARVAQPPADPWTDGVARIGYVIWVNGNNWLALRKAVGVNRLDVIYRSGGINSDQIINTDTTDFFQLVQTWSSVANQARSFFNGVEVGVPRPVGVWVGLPSLAIVGAFSVVPGAVWHGNIAHAAVWDRALTPAEVLNLYEEGVF